MAPEIELSTPPELQIELPTPPELELSTPPELQIELPTPPEPELSTPPLETRSPICRLWPRCLQSPRQLLPKLLLLSRPLLLILLLPVLLFCWWLTKKTATTVAVEADPSHASFWMGFLKGMLKPVAALAAVLMAVALSFSQNLKLEGEMIYAIARTFLQLSVIGFVLQFIFTHKNAAWIILAYLFMVSIAGYTAGQRAKHVPRGKYIAGISIFAGTAVTMFLLLVLNVFPLTPRYFIPVAGMMIGNAMTVTGVTMKTLREDVKMQKNLVETALALGATPRQATHQQVKRSLVIALSPVIDNAKTVGLISLPGAMTGLIMGGASPLQAIQLQIVVMNMLIGAATVSSILSTYLCWPAFFTKAYQLEYKVFASD